MNAFTAAADPTRRRIMELLSRGEMSAGDIGKRFEMSAPAVSQHLKILREARLVRVRVDAQRRVYTPDPAGLDEMQTWLNQVRAFWNPRLDKLEGEIKKAAAKRKGRGK